jgi:hypothetical protein
MRTLYQQIALELGNLFTLIDMMRMQTLQQMNEPLRKQSFLAPRKIASCRIQASPFDTTRPNSSKRPWT